MILAADVAATHSALCLGASADEIENAVYDGMQVAQRISMMFAFEVGNGNLEMQQHADLGNPEDHGVDNIGVKTPETKKLYGNSGNTASTAVCKDAAMFEQHVKDAADEWMQGGAVDIVGNSAIERSERISAMKALISFPRRPILQPQMSIQSSPMYISWSPTSS